MNQYAEMPIWILRLTNTPLSEDGEDADIAINFAIIFALKLLNLASAIHYNAIIACERYVWSPEKIKINKTMKSDLSQLLVSR